MIDPERYAQLEALYDALLAHQKDPRNTTWRPVLKALAEVGKPPIEEAFEELSSE